MNLGENIQTNNKTEILNSFNPLFIFTPSVYCTPFSIGRTSLTTKYMVATNWSGSPNKAEMNNLNSGALLSSKYRPWLEQK